MPPDAPVIWSFSRRLAGNLFPLVLSTPFFLWAMIELARNGLTLNVVWGTLGFVVVGWLATNFLGLWGNGWMKRQMETRFRSLREDEADAVRYFVGFAKPNFKGALDPHQDVGLLILKDGGLEFWGSELKFEMPWSVVKEVRRRRNIHSWLGLGGWVSVEGEVAGKEVRMLIEPRVKGTLLGNRAFSKVLISELRARVKK